MTTDPKSAGHTPLVRYGADNEPMVAWTPYDMAVQSLRRLQEEAVPDAKRYRLPKSPEEYLRTRAAHIIKDYADKTLGYRVNEMATEVQSLRAELGALDELLSRRPALADDKTRTDKIEHALREAGKVEPLKAELTRTQREAFNSAAALKAEVDGAWYQRDQYKKRAEEAEADLARVTLDRDIYKAGSEVVKGLAEKADATTSDLMDVLEEAFELDLSGDGSYRWREKVRAAIDKARGRKGEGT